MTLDVENSNQDLRERLEESALGEEDIKVAIHEKMQTFRHMIEGTKVDELKYDQTYSVHLMASDSSYARAN